MTPVRLHLFKEIGFSSLSRGFPVANHLPFLGLCLCPTPTQRPLAFDPIRLRAPPGPRAPGPCPPAAARNTRPERGATAPLRGPPVEKPRQKGAKTPHMPSEVLKEGRSMGGGATKDREIDRYIYIYMFRCLFVYLVVD